MTFWSRAQLSSPFTIQRMSDWEFFGRFCCATKHATVRDGEIILACISPDNKIATFIQTGLCCCGVEYNPNLLSRALGWIENSSNYGWMDGVVSEKRFTGYWFAFVWLYSNYSQAQDIRVPTASTEWTHRLIIHMLIPIVYAMSGARDRSDSNLHTADNKTLIENFSSSCINERLYLLLLDARSLLCWMWSG